MDAIKAHFAGPEARNDGRAVKQATNDAIIDTPVDSQQVVISTISTLIERLDIIATP